MRGQRPRGVATAAALVCGALGCVLPAARWNVPPGSERRFTEARKVCHQLTSPSQDRFEDCMERRGFEHESLLSRARRLFTGG